MCPPDLRTPPPDAIATAVNKRQRSAIGIESRRERHRAPTEPTPGGRRTSTCSTARLAGGGSPVPARATSSWASAALYRPGGRPSAGLPRIRASRRRRSCQARDHRAGSCGRSMRIRMRPLGAPSRESASPENQSSRWPSLPAPLATPTPCPRPVACSARRRQRRRRDTQLDGRRPVELAHGQRGPSTRGQRATRQPDLPRHRQGGRALAHGRRGAVELDHRRWPGRPSGVRFPLDRGARRRKDAVRGGRYRRLFISRNDGATWHPFDQDLPNAIIGQILWSNGYLYAVTYGRGLWRRRPCL